jgi:hypothetical protein
MIVLTVLKGCQPEVLRSSKDEAFCEDKGNSVVGLYGELTEKVGKRLVLLQECIKT